MAVRSRSQLQGQGSSSTPSGSGSDGGGGGGSSSKRPRTTMKPVPAAHLAALRGRYELLKSKGNGAFAEVWEAKHLRTGNHVAIKIICHADLAGDYADVDREVAAMRLLRHYPHVVHFYESIRSADHTYIVMEFAESGQLYDHLVVADRQRLTEPEARRVFRQLVAGVAFCHRNFVVHRDLKMENVLLDSEGNVKVADFGLSDFWSNERLLSRSCGSPEYAAPELHERREYRGPEVDVWSCGVVLYIMLCGRMPFDGADVSEVARNVRRGEYRVPSWVSDDARDLIAGMLVVRQEKRATIAEVMAHRWLSPEPDTTSPPATYLTRMPPPDAAALRARARVVVDAAAVELLVTRHGFESTASLMESLRLDDDESEAAVAYQLVLRNKYGAAALYQQLLYMPPPPPPASAAAALYQQLLSMPAAAAAAMAPPRRQWVLGGGLNGGELLLHDCPRETMRRIASALGQLGVRILSYQSQCHLMACAHIAGAGGATFRRFVGGASGSSSSSVRSAATFRSFLRHNDGGASSSGSEAPEMSNNILRSLSAAVIFEIELFKAGEGEHDDTRQQRQYALHLKRTSGPQIPYLRVCSQLASKLRPQI